MRFSLTASFRNEDKRQCQVTLLRDNQERTGRGHLRREHRRQGTGSSGQDRRTCPPAPEIHAIPRFFPSLATRPTRTSIAPTPRPPRAPRSSPRPCPDRRTQADAERRGGRVKRKGLSLAQCQQARDMIDVGVGDDHRSDRAVAQAAPWMQKRIGDDLLTQIR